MIEKNAASEPADPGDQFSYIDPAGADSGPTGRGELALVLLYPQLVANIAFLGVDRAIAIQGGRGELASPVSTIMKLALLFSVPAVLVGYITVSLRVSDAHLAGLAKIYLSYVPAMYLFLLAVSLFNGAGDFVRFNSTRLSFYVGNFALVLFIWIASPGISFLLDCVVWANLLSVFERWRWRCGCFTASGIPREAALWM
jgi:hypothetical protein